MTELAQKVLLNPSISDILIGWSPLRDLALNMFPDVVQNRLRKKFYSSVARKFPRPPFFTNKIGKHLFMIIYQTLSPPYNQ